MQISGQVAVVTGGASGLGAATAKMIAEQGGKVGLLDLNEDGVKARAEEIGGIGIACNVADPEAVAKALETIGAEYGPPRIAVNCAGIPTPGKIVGRNGPLDLDVYRRVIEVNLIGTFNVLRLAAAGMQGLDPIGDDNERGVIINTASVAAFEGQVGQAAYASSKGGVAALTLPAAREFAKTGIRVNTIAPGLFHTPMFDSLPQEAIDSLIATTVYPKRLGQGAEYAQLARQMIENPMINGATYRLDGSLRMAPQ